MTIAHNSATEGQSILVWTLVVFFILQIARISLTLVRVRKRRLAGTMLLLSVLLWASGSALLNAGGVPDLTHFPSRGELLFLGSYIAMAAYLLLSARRDASMPLDTWLHVVVICGGAVCLAGSLVFVPIGNAYHVSALSLFLAVLYPLIDLVLAVLVIGQALLRMRENLAESLGLLGGFLLFAFADSHFVTDLSSGTYNFSVVSDAAWGAGFALIVGAACRKRTGSARTVPRALGSTETMVAAIIAILVLALEPGHGLRLYLTIPAVLTLLGAGGRLVLALRDARGVAEALALSRTDDLTRLPNRRALHADLEAAFDAARPLSLMLLDLDGFKDVNDTLGHSVGDGVLQLMAHRLREALPPSVTVARLGGDEFAVIVYGNDVIVAMEIAQDLLNQVREPVRVDGIEILPSASIGIAPREGNDVGGSELLRRADVAMYQAKHQRIGVALYDAGDDDFSKAKLMLAEDLRKALDDHHFELWYQPQIDTDNGQMCGLEALLRWRHPVQGIVPPVSFLPAARQAGLMPAISSRVAELALRDIHLFRASGLDDVRVAINCAPPELLSGSFLPDLYRQLANADVPADCLTIEVTEDSFMADPDRARQVLEEVREHGLQVAIDDYGTGFSSLAYLRDLAVDELKIDRSFVSTVLEDPRTRMIVSSTVQLARGLSMRTVAEGVEDVATADELSALGVDVLQGYLIAKPMAPADVIAWSRAQHQLAEGAASESGPKRTEPANEPIRAKRSLRVLAPHRGASR